MELPSRCIVCSPAVMNRGENNMDAQGLVILLASSELPCIARHQHSGAPDTDLVGGQ